MYGLVNEGIRELVSRQAGVDVWQEICREARIDPEGFSPLETYPDSLTYTLVGLASKKLGLPQDEILRKFGEHWILYTAAHGYGDMLNLFGLDFRTCLKNLNKMHGHMGAMMPNLSPPRFAIDETTGEKITVHYYSTRAGLGPMVIGLLEGLAIKYKETVSIVFHPRETRSDHDEFDVTFVAV